MVLQLADKTVTTLPKGTKVSVLDDAGNILATNTAKVDISVNRADAVKYGTTTTFLYDNGAYDGWSWKTTTGSISDINEIKQVKIEYTVEGVTYTKTVPAEEYKG